MGNKRLRRGIAVLARGLREYEILHTPLGNEVALTLFRSVGWLSRGDLFVRSDQAGPDVETPAAQFPRCGVRPGWAATGGIRPVSTAR